MSFEEIFSPGIRFWKEFQDEQETKRAEAPAPGPGPVTVDLDKGIITIEQPVESDPGQESTD
jgi:hypothetical protein